MATRLGIPESLLDGFLDGMGATPETTTANFAYVSEVDMTDMISKLVVDGRPHDDHEGHGDEAV